MYRRQRTSYISKATLVLASVALVTALVVERSPMIATAFSAVSAQGNALSSTRRCDASSCRLLAIVYGEDGDYSSYDETDETSSASSSLIGLISESESAKLARLAAAFAPPGHEIHPNQLEAAQVINIDSHHIEISAVTCDTEECVTLFVPVEFPESCTPVDDDDDSPHSLEACVMENLQQLNDDALERIRKQEWKIDHKEELELDELVWQNLRKEESFDELPKWWIPPKEYYDSYANIGLIDECERVKDLLNEDEFRDDVVSLATKVCTEQYPLDTFKLTHSAVTRVGPFGLMIKARVRLDEKDTLTIDLPVKFSSSAETIDELRACVLGIVVPV